MTAATTSKALKGFEHAQVLFSIKQFARLCGMTREQALGLIKRQNIPTYLDGKRRYLTFDGICQASIPMALSLLTIWGLCRKSTPSFLRRSVSQNVKTRKGEDAK